MAYADYEAGFEPNLTVSTSESQALNLQIYRCTSRNWEADCVDVSNQIVQSDADVVILRTRDSRPDIQVENFELIEAGELVYWSSPVNPQFEPLANGFTYDNGVKNLAGFRAVVESSFEGYKNHYSFDPVFESLDVESAYVDWAMKRLESNDINDLAGLLSFDGEPVGAITGVQSDHIIEIELAGIHQNFQGKGFYGQLIAGFWNTVSNPELSRIVISTQKENASVQKAWTKLGFTYEFSAFTTHFVRQDVLKTQKSN